LKENTSHHSFTFLGAWAASTAYALDDVVTTTGKTYICILAYTSGSSFAVGSNWSLMAEKGTNGTNGTDVGTGASGQALKTNSAGTGLEWGDVSTSGGLLEIKSYTSWGVNTDFSSWNSRSTSAQSATWTKPAGCTQVLVYVTGGGGGGCRGDGSYRGATGGAGGTSIGYFNVSSTSTVAITIGAGGIAVTTTGERSPSGTNSSFGSYCTGLGGQGSISNSPYEGGFGGGATGGQLNLIGGSGSMSHGSNREGQGGASFWHQAGSRHGGDERQQGHFGSGGSNSGNGQAAYHSNGGAGVVVVYAYT